MDTVLTFEPYPRTLDSRISFASSGVDGGLPDVAVGTLPPDPFCTARRDHFGCERAVKRRMPLSSNARFYGCQIIEAS